MYYILAILASVLITVMIAVNGNLSSVYGIYMATVIIHIVGLITTTIISIMRREKLFKIKRIEKYLFLGGAIGVLTTILNNESFGKISTSAIIALILLGQTVCSLLLDNFGMIGMQVIKFNKIKLIGLIATLMGIIIMIFNVKFALFPVLFSFIAGATIVIARNLNAVLSEKTSSIVSTWYNYVVGLLVSVFVLFISKIFLANNISIHGSYSNFIYIGGLIGVCVVVISNITVTKMPAFIMTLIMFVGQIFAGVVIDAFLLGSVDFKNIIGGICVIIGLSANMFLDYKFSKVVMQ